MKKILKRASLVVAALAAALTAAVVLLERRTYDAPYPAIAASDDPAVIARGRYLVYGPAHCASCHGAPEGEADLAAGREVPLSGGHAFHLPIGTVRAPNLTADRATGLGALSDGEIARALRYRVGRDGRALMPFMPFAELGDADLTAIVSFLRTQAPVPHRVVRRELNPLGHVMAAFVLKPADLTAARPPAVPPGPTVAHGRYLAHGVANCVGCHTKMDLRTGKFVAPPFSGGMAMESHLVPGTTFVTPNLTPDPKTGRLASWSEEVFVARFRTGKGAHGSPMPWAAFGRMTDDDLRAIYRYLGSLGAVENDTGDTVRGGAVAAAR
jgi:mono/diheme cytochrome c family protein